MTPTEVYVDYNALKRHFSSTYDYHKYNGKIRVNTNDFDSRPEKVFCMKIAKHQDPHGLLLANVVYDPKIWIRDLAYSDAAETRYVEWSKRVQSLNYVLKNELDQFSDSNFNDLLISGDGKHPLLVRAYEGGRVSLETLSVIVDMSDCHEYWTKKFPYDPVVENLVMKVRKYSPFLKYDREKARDTIVSLFDDV